MSVTGKRHLFYRGDSINIFRLLRQLLSHFSLFFRKFPRIFASFATKIIPAKRYRRVRLFISVYQRGEGLHHGITKYLTIDMGFHGGRLHSRSTSFQILLQEEE